MPRFIDPNFLNIVWSFSYRGWSLEVDRSQQEDGQVLYSVWANHATGSAVAVPGAATQTEAVRRAKRYVDLRIKKKERWSLDS